jgi:HK97 family phage major capsid protein
MSERLDVYEAEKRRHTERAKELLATAKTEDRSPTEDERAEIEREMASATTWAQKIADLQDNETLEASIQRLGDAMTSEPSEKIDSARARSIGEAFVGSDGYRALLVQGMSGTWRTPTLEYLGAAGDAVLKSTGSNADAIFEQQLGGLKTPGLIQEVPSLAQLFASGTAEGGTIKYIKTTTRDAPANAVTVESQQKPGAEFAFDDVTVTLQKLAAFIPVSEEMLEDSQVIADYINAQLPFMVRQAEDKKLATEIYAAATGVGLSTTIGGTDANGFDAIADAIKDVQVASQTDPDGLFINPVDWWTLAVKKSTTSGDYYSGGPYAGPARNPWGLRTVISQRAPAGFPLVGNFQQGGQVFRKGGIRLEASNSHLDYFRTNLVAIRAEERVALAVYYPEMFSVANLAS